MKRKSSPWLLAKLAMCCLLLMAASLMDMSAQSNLVRNRLQLIAMGKDADVRQELPDLLADFPDDPAVKFLHAVLVDERETHDLEGLLLNRLVDGFGGRRLFGVPQPVAFDKACAGAGAVKGGHRIAYARRSITVTLRRPREARASKGDGQRTGRSSFEARHNASQTRVDALMTRTSG